MKTPHMKLFTSVFAALLIAAPTLFSAENFEGRIKMTMSGPGGASVPTTFSIKPGFTRMDMEMQGMTMATIIDQAKNTAYMLMPQQQMYMVREIPKADEKADKGADDVTVDKTNEHAKIAGYDTTKYIVKSKDSTSEVWVTDQLGTFTGMNTGGPGARRSSAGQAWEKAFRGKSAFPLRVVAKMDDGQEFRMEATSVEKTSIPASEFEPPAGWQKMDMGMMQGMGRGMPGMPGGRPQPQQQK